MFDIPADKLTSKHFKEIMAYLHLLENMVDIDPPKAVYKELENNMYI